MTQRSLSRTGTFKARTAPARLRILQAFVNTRDVETGRDELWNPEKLAEWLVEQKLVAAGTVLDKDAWETALTIREALREQFRAHNGAKVDGRPMETLSRAFGDLNARLFLTSKGVVGIEGADAGWPGALARLLLAMSFAKNKNLWKRLKACRSEECQWIFYDASRNLAGRWCSVNRCGNRTNTRTYRRRGPAYSRF